MKKNNKTNQTEQIKQIKQNKTNMNFRTILFFDITENEIGNLVDKAISMVNRKRNKHKHTYQNHSKKLCYVSKTYFNTCPSFTLNPISKEFRFRLNPMAKEFRPFRLNPMAKEFIPQTYTNHR